MWWSDYGQEVVSMIVDFEQTNAGKTGAEQLMGLRAMNAALLELIQRHKRALDFQAGEPVEPEVHLGSADLVAVVGGAQ